MKRKLILFVPSVVALLTVLSGPAAAHHIVDNDCDGFDDTTGEPWHGRANGVCGGVGG